MYKFNMLEILVFVIALIFLVKKLVDKYKSL